MTIILSDVTRLWKTRLVALAKSKDHFHEEGWKPAQISTHTFFTVNIVLSLKSIWMFPKIGGNPQNGW